MRPDPTRPPPRATAGAARHLLSIALLPFVVTVVVPWRLLASPGRPFAWWTDGSALRAVAQSGGALALVSGLVLFAWCVRLFASVGQGTLAPWDPTRRLVAVGPYRYTRNPMITAVAAILAGETLITGSRSLAVWLAVFVVINHLYFVTVEEPGLRRRFGTSYEEYSRHVPRWIPRLRPWGGQ